MAGLDTLGFQQNFCNQEEECVKTVRLRIIAGHDLPYNKDVFSRDPYVSISLIFTDEDGQVKVVDSARTSTKKRTLQPIWEEDFLFRVINPIKHSLILDLMDNVEGQYPDKDSSKDPGHCSLYNPKDNLMGTINIPLSTVAQEPELDSKGLEYELNNKITCDNHCQFIQYFNLQPSNRLMSTTKIKGSLSIALSFIFTPPEINIPVQIGKLPSAEAEGSKSNCNSNSVNDSKDELLEATATKSNNASNQELDNIVKPSSDNSAKDDHCSLASCSNAEESLENLHSKILSLPEGWEQCVDLLGRIYYSDHNTMTTHWDPPVSSCNSASQNQVTSGEFRRLQENEPSSMLTLGETAHCVRGDDSNNNTIENDTEGSLPPGWSSQRTTSGRLFFIDHSNERTTWIDPRSGLPSPLPKLSKSNNSTHNVALVRIPERPKKRTQNERDLLLEPLPDGWEARVYANGRNIYINHHEKTTQFEDPRVTSRNTVPFSPAFRQKYDFFKQELTNMQPRMQLVPTAKKLEIRVRRETLLENSYDIISTASPDSLLMNLWIVFEDEPSSDYGGLTREWFFKLSREIFNPHNGLFQYSAWNNYMLQINPASGLCVGMHLNYFRFIGRVVGMAIFHGQVLDARLSHLFFKLMLDRPIKLEDIESVDWEFYKSLLWIKENDPTELGLTFNIEDDMITGCSHQIDLKPNGAQIPVDNSNKLEYIKLFIEWRYVSRIKRQMTAFLEGFKKLIPLQSLNIFNEKELEQLLCGIRVIDINDWKQNTIYKGNYHHNHKVILWFWRPDSVRFSQIQFLQNRKCQAVSSFSNEMRGRLLQFVTGTSRLPMNGFRQLYGSNGPQLFTIVSCSTDSHYPRAHTCFNQLNLPTYESYEALKEKIIEAVQESQGFADFDNY